MNIKALMATIGSILGLTGFGVGVAIYPGGVLTVLLLVIGLGICYMVYQSFCEVFNE